MTNLNFKLVKNVQTASDFGLQWFENGSGRQAIYTLYFNENPIKTYITTNADKKIYAIVEIGNKAVNGVVIVPNVEIIYEVKFSINPNKKTYGTRKIVVTNEN
ncbi:MAG: hypothetical protein RL656_1192 [Bacteroidota bacterium]|jgi:hypothetical protein